MLSVEERNRFFSDVNEIRGFWGWFLAFGLILIILGLICVVADNPATWATILVFGWILLVGGMVALVQAFRVHTWSGFFLHLQSALLRGFTGLLLIRYTGAGAVALTLLLASFFVVGGLLRAVGASKLKFPRWGWTTLSGILSFVLGILLLIQLPLSSIWFIGFAIGLDMIVEGAALVALAMTIHTLSRLPDYRTTA